MDIAKPMFPWVGGKERLIPMIRQVMPSKMSQYMEPFGGSGANLLGMPPERSRLDIYNDYNQDLVNFFLCARDRPLSLVRELGFLPLNSRAEFEYLIRFLKQEEMGSEYVEDEIAIAEEYFPPGEAEEVIALLRGRAELLDVRRAAAFFKVSRYSYSGTMTSYGVKACDLKHFFHLIWSASRRLARVVIERQDAIELIRKRDRPDGVIYCDPPYFQAEKSYAVKFRYRDHARLHRVLKQCKGAVIVSYNDCRYIRFLYDDFYILAFRRENQLAKEKGALYGELLITNYDPRPFMNLQMNLFGAGTGAKWQPVLINIPRHVLKTLEEEDNHEIYTAP